MAFLSADHLTPATGKTIAITISKNGAAFGNPSVGATNATEIANGWYYVDMSTTDTGTVGPLIVHGAAATIDNVDIAYNVVAASVDANVVSIAASAITAASIATGAIDADALATDAVSEIADGLLDRSDAIEVGATPRQALRLVTAATAGKLSGAATTTNTIRNAVADSKNRIVATVDSDGNRTAITYDVT